MFNSFWHEQPRTNSIRVPMERRALREPQPADSACNPYPTATFALAAGPVEGIREKLDPGRPRRRTTSMNFSEPELAQRGHQLPAAQPRGSGRGLRRRSLHRENAFGKGLRDEFITYKSEEAGAPIINK